jgi:hypothetical protein
VPAETNTHATLKELVDKWFSVGPCRDVITETTWGNQVQFCMGICEEGTWVREGEGSLLLEAVTWEPLMKTQKTRKSLEGAVVICELWKLAVAL